MPIYSIPGTAVQDPEAHLSQRLLEEYDAIQRPWAQKAVDNRAFVHNMQFTPEQLRLLEARNQMAEPFNILLPAVDTTKSILTANNPRFRVSPAEGSDRKSAMVMEDLVDWVWSGQMDAQSQAALEKAIEDYIVTGRGVLLCWQDFNADLGRGELRISDSDPLKWYPSPNTQDRWWRDAAHILYTDLVTPQQLVDRLGPDIVNQIPFLSSTFVSRIPESSFGYHHDAPPATSVGPFQAPILGSFVPSSQGMTEHKYEYIERYTKFTAMIHHVTDEEGIEKEIEDAEMNQWLDTPVLMITDGMTRQATADPIQIRRYLTVAMSRGQRTGERDFIIPGSPNSPTLALRLTSRREMVARGELQARPVRVPRIQLCITVGGRKVHARLLPISRYPVVPFQNRWNRNPYPESDIAFARPLQMELNKVHMQILAHAATTTGPMILVPKGSHDVKEIERSATKVGLKVVEVDMELGAPVVVNTQQLAAEFFQLVERIREGVYELLGIWPFMQGNPQNLPTNQPYSSTLMLQENAQTRLATKLRDIQGGLRELGRTALELIPKTYTREKVLSLVQPNGQVKETPINQLLYDDFSATVRVFNDVTRGRYDLRVVAGSTLPTSRMAREQRTLALYQAGLVDDVEALKHLEEVDVEGVLERKGLYSQQAQMIQQLQELLQQAQGDLQTWQREALHAKMQAILADYKRKLDHGVNRADQAVSLFDARLKDQLRLQQQEFDLQQRHAEQLAAFSRTGSRAA